MASPKFSAAALIFQAALIVLFGILVDYGDHALPPHKRGAGLTLNDSYSKELVTVSRNEISVFYSCKYTRANGL
jgi:hypothetical protein